MPFFPSLKLVSKCGSFIAIFAYLPSPPDFPVDLLPYFFRARLVELPPNSDSLKEVIL